MFCSQLLRCRGSQPKTRLESSIKKVDPPPSFFFPRFTDLCETRDIIKILLGVCVYAPLWHTAMIVACYLFVATCYEKGSLGDSWQNRCNASTPRVQFLLLFTCRQFCSVLFYSVDYAVRPIKMWRCCKVWHTCTLYGDLK